MHCQRCPDVRDVRSRTGEGMGATENAPENSIEASGVKLASRLKTSTESSDNLAPDSATLGLTSSLRWKVAASRTVAEG